MEKAEIRKLGKAGRASIKGDVRVSYEEAICQEIRKSEAYQNAKRILSYQAFGGEVRLDGLKEMAKEDGKELAFPYCTDKVTMIALIPQDEDSWGEDLYGIAVPIPEKSVEARPESLDMILTPLVAFDEKCNRTGMGAGVYDRYLPKCENAKIIGIAFEAQKMPEIPTDEHDVTLQGVITEKACYHPN